MQHDVIRNLLKNLEEPVSVSLASLRVEDIRLGSTDYIVTYYTRYDMEFKRLFPDTTASYELLHSNTRKRFCNQKAPALVQRLSELNSDGWLNLLDYEIPKAYQGA